LSLACSTPAWLIDQVRQYINQHGFGEPTPPLSKALTVKQFNEHYYDKKALMQFCRLVGLPSSGAKPVLNQRIAHYLATGECLSMPKSIRFGGADSEGGLSLDKPVVHYKSDVATRRFLEAHVRGLKRFSAKVQKDIKEALAHETLITYGDVVKMYHEHLADQAHAKKHHLATRVTHGACQYNQFAIDYAHDDEPKVHTLKEAWSLVRYAAGENTYKRYKAGIQTIIECLEAESNKV